MFGSSKKVEEKKPTTTTSTPNGPNSLNALVKGTLVEGDVKSESDLRVDGTIKGRLNCAAKVIIGPTGHVDGEIRCQNAVIEGRLTGNIWVSELLNLRETATIDGNIHTAKFTAQPGAEINGTIKMDGASSNGIAHQHQKNVSTATVAAGTATAKN